VNASTAIEGSLADAGVGRHDKAHALIGASFAANRTSRLQDGTRPRERRRRRGGRQRIARMLRDLGVPDGEVRTSVR
jgi:hypothetical protein